MQAHEFIRRLEKGLTYEAYVAAWEEAMRQPLAGLDPQPQATGWY